MTVEYQIENELSITEFISVLERSGLAERRPVGEIKRIELMLKNANLILTARINGELIGVARSISDFAFCTYLSDLAVVKKYQSKGIGKTLIKKTWETAPLAKLILLSAPAATEYYPKIGMDKHHFCFLLDDGNKIK
jgi:predicted N-acetyltransferase YhbS